MGTHQPEVAINPVDNDRKQCPELSFVMACFNEMDVIGVTIPYLIGVFQKEGYRIEVVAVDNGSNDGTGQLIKDMADAGLPVIPCRVDVNQGYGFGVLSGIPHCSAQWVGIIPADLQVDPRDVVTLYEAAAMSHNHRVFKVRRRFRFEGPLRRIVSVTYNMLATLLFGNLQTSDINGIPKLIAASLLRQLNLQSKDWFLDAEIMIKAKKLNEPVYEFNCFSQMRPGGKSNVRVGTCVEFLINLFKYRFTRTGRFLELVDIKARIVAGNDSQAIRSSDVRRDASASLATVQAVSDASKGS